MILKSQGSVSSSGSGSGASMNGGKSVKPLSAWTRIRFSRSRMVVTAIASCRSTCCAITDTRSKTSRTSRTPDSVARRSSSIRRLSARSRSAAARRASSAIRWCSIAERHVLGDPARDVDVGLAVGRHRGRAELQRAADAAIEQEREPQRRTKPGPRGRPVALGGGGEQILEQGELKVLVEHGRVVGREHLGHLVPRDAVERVDLEVRMIVGQDLNRGGVVRQDRSRHAGQSMKDVADVEGAGDERQHLLDAVHARQAREPNVARFGRVQRFGHARRQRLEGGDLRVGERRRVALSRPEQPFAVGQRHHQQAVDPVAHQAVDDRMRHLRVVSAAG